MGIYIYLFIYLLCNYVFMYLCIYDAYFLPRHIIHAIYFQLVHLSMHLCTMYQTAIFSYLCGPYSNNDSWSLFASAPRTMSRRPTSFCRSGRRWVTLRRPRRRKRMKLWNYANGFWGRIIHKMLFLIWHWHAFAYSIFFPVETSR